MKKLTGILLALLCALPMARADETQETTLDAFRAEFQKQETAIVGAMDALMAPNYATLVTAMRESTKGKAYNDCMNPAKGADPAKACEPLIAEVDEVYNVWNELDSKRLKKVDPVGRQKAFNEFVDGLTRPDRKSFATEVRGYLLAKYKEYNDAINTFESEATEKMLVDCDGEIVGKRLACVLDRLIAFYDVDFPATMVAKRKLLAQDLIIVVQATKDYADEPIVQ